MQKDDRAGIFVVAYTVSRRWIWSGNVELHSLNWPSWVSWTRWWSIKGMDLTWSYVDDWESCIDEEGKAKLYRGRNFVLDFFKTFSKSGTTLRQYAVWHEERSDRGSANKQLHIYFMF